MSGMLSDKNELVRITGSSFVGGNYTRHEQREFTCSAVQYGRAKYGLFCKICPPLILKWVSFRSRTRNAMFVHLACHLVKVLFLFVSQQKTTVVFDVALAVLPIWNNAFGINWYIAYSSWHMILWKHYICSSLRVLWSTLSREAFKADKNSLSSLASSDTISSQDFFDWETHCHTGNQS